MYRGPWHCAMNSLRVAKFILSLPSLFLSIVVYSDPCVCTHTEWMSLEGLPTVLGWPLVMSHLSIPTPSVTRFLCHSSSFLLSFFLRQTRAHRHTEEMLSDQKAIIESKCENVIAKVNAGCIMHAHKAHMFVCIWQLSKSFRKEGRGGSPGENIVRLQMITI